MNKHEILREVTFGKRVAEDEVGELTSYFVETDQWQRIYSGEVDIVYGTKGSGKSAIYTLLLSRTNALFDRSILITPAENPRGTPVFKDLAQDPPANEEEFRNLWKLYLLSLVAGTLRDYGMPMDLAGKVIGPLEDAGLLPHDWSLKGVLRAVGQFVRKWTNAEAIEGGLEFDPTTGMPKGLSGKISLREPTKEQRHKGIISADQLLDFANKTLENSSFQVWLVLDRLDVAFAESPELEGRALRALFRVYLDFAAFSRISLKIFIRSDIWKRITSSGFREASHITRHVSLKWDKDALLNLVIRRALQNQSIKKHYNVDGEEILRDKEAQYSLFYRIYPKQIRGGSNKPTTFDWMLSRTRDALVGTAPRELIHLLSSTRETQLRRIEVGNPEPSDEAIFDRNAIREALQEVSQVRIEQTLYAEYPELRKWLQALEGQRTQQSLETLSTIWKVDIDTAKQAATDLVDVGFFEKRSIREKPAYWVPFLFREGLGMVQGSAIPDVEDGDQEELDL